MLDTPLGYDMVHTMYYEKRKTEQDIPIQQVRQFRDLVQRMFLCCQERMHHQCEKFKIPDAEIRCLMLFGADRYLTAKGISNKLDVVKSRVTRIVDGLIQKRLIQKVQDPEDSRVVLLSLTSSGQKILNEINDYMHDLHTQVLTQIPSDQRSVFLNNLEMLRLCMETVNERLR
jgi:DNA-binding MarR family transcriptional regulator